MTQRSLTTNSSWIKELPKDEQNLLFDIAKGDFHRLDTPREFTFVFFAYEKTEILKGMMKELESQGWSVSIDSSASEPTQESYYLDTLLPGGASHKEYKIFEEIASQYNLIYATLDNDENITHRLMQINDFTLADSLQKKLVKRNYSTEIYAEEPSSLSVTIEAQKSQYVINQYSYPVDKHHMQVIAKKFGVLYDGWYASQE